MPGRRDAWARTPRAGVWWLQVGVRPRHTVGSEGSTARALAQVLSSGAPPAAPQTALTASPVESQVLAQKGLPHASPAGRRLGGMEKEPKDKLMKERQATLVMTRLPNRVLNDGAGPWHRPGRPGQPSLFRLMSARTKSICSLAHCSCSDRGSLLAFARLEPLRRILALTPPSSLPSPPGTKHSTPIWSQSSQT